MGGKWHLQDILDRWKQPLKAHDATCLLQERDTPTVEFDDILIDQGTDDELLENELKPEALKAAAF